MKREKTKHKGIYKVGDTYYITYYVGSKKYEKAVGPRLSIALNEKMEREHKAKRGNYEAVERQEKTTFDELVDLYKREGDGKKYILIFIPVYLKHFGSYKLSEDVKKLNFITVTSRAKLKMVRQGFADHEDGISVSLIRGRNEPFEVKLLETLHLFNAIFLAHHPNYAHWGLQHKRIHCLML